MKSITKKISLIGTGIVTSFVLLNNLYVFADGEAGPALKNPIGVTSFSQVISAILSVVVAIGTILVVLAVIYSGYLFVTAQGNSEKIESAKKIFVWTIVGAIVLLGAQLLSEVIVATARQIGVKI